MKSGIHPEVHKKAKCKCTTCNAVFEIPSTMEDITVETCCKCHPAYTGKERKEMKGGRVERFRKRMAAGKKQESK